MPYKTKVTCDDILAAIDKLNKENDSKWMVSQLADELGVAYTSIYNYRKKWRAVDIALLEMKERRKDWGESLLFKRMGEGDTASIIFYVKTQLKDRGYIERQELSGLNGQPVEVNTKLELSDDELRKQLESLGRAALLVAGGGAALHDTATIVASEDSDSEKE